MSKMTNTSHVKHKGNCAASEMINLSLFEKETISPRLQRKNRAELTKRLLRRDFTDQVKTRLRYGAVLFMSKSHSESEKPNL